MYHKRVFVVSEVDDTYVYHIHVEIMPRIMYHLEFLLANPDIKILFGCDSKKKDYITQAGLAHGPRREPHRSPLLPRRRARPRWSRGSGGEE